MNTKFGNEFHQFGILAVVTIIAIENLSQQVMVTQLMSATLVIILGMAYIINTISEN